MLLIQKIAVKSRLTTNFCDYNRHLYKFLRLNNAIIRAEASPEHGNPSASTSLSKKIALLWNKTIFGHVNDIGANLIMI
jgi:hypothetical protein